MTIEIMLTKGYTAIVDDVDKDLANFKWATHARGYPYRTMTVNGKRKTIMMHNVIMQRMMADTAGLICDHINGNPQDCRRDNLRLATSSQNSQNRKIRKNKNSIFKGVILNKRRFGDTWSAVIKANGKQIWLGTYGTPYEAHEAYCAAAIKYFGEFARFE